MNVFIPVDFYGGSIGGVFGTLEEAVAQAKNEFDQIDEFVLGTNKRIRSWTMLTDNHEWEKWEENGIDLRSRE